MHVPALYGVLVKTKVVIHLVMRLTTKNICKLFGFQFVLSVNICKCTINLHILVDFRDRDTCVVL